jgi:hypothetical protein
MLPTLIEKVTFFYTLITVVIYICRLGVSNFLYSPTHTWSKLSHWITSGAGETPTIDLSRSLTPHDTIHITWYHNELEENDDGT